MLEIVRDFYRNEEGATAIEYGFIAALIAIAIMAALLAIGTNCVRWTSPRSGLAQRMSVSALVITPEVRSIFGW